MGFRHRQGSALLVLGLLSIAVPPRTSSLPGQDAPPPAPPAPVEELAARVNRAIDGGVAWVRKSQREDGSFAYRLDASGTHAPPPSGDMKPMDQSWAGGPWQTGANALALYALAACEVPPDDPAFVLGVKRVRADWDGRRASSFMGSGDGISTYYVSLTLLALDAAWNRSTAPMGKGPPPPPPAPPGGGGPGGGPPGPPPGPPRAAALGAWRRAAPAPGKEGWNRAPWNRGGFPIPGDPPPDGGKRKKKPPKRGEPPPSLPVPTGKTPSFEDGGGFSYESPIHRSSGYHDHSNSQFAYLGLKAASRLGVKVPDDVWIRGLRHFLAAQEADGPEVSRVEAPGAVDPAPRRKGADPVTVAAERVMDRARGWTYMCRGSDGKAGAPSFGERVTAAMAAGGVSTLVLCRSELEGVKAFTPDLRERTERAIRDGLAWLALHFDDGARPEGPRTPPGMEDMSDIRDGFGDFYYAYGLERACILGGVQRVGARDWYEEGARLIVERVRGDGSIIGKNRNNGNGTDLFDTCFALLFLKRALFRMERAVATPADTGLVLDGAADLAEAGFADLFGAVFRRFASGDAAARGERAADFVRMGPRSLPLLVARLGDDDREARAAALEALERTTGETRGFNPDGTPEARAAAAARWEEWWSLRGARVEADEASGRFVEN